MKNEKGAKKGAKDWAEYIYKGFEEWKGAKKQAPKAGGCASWTNAY